MTASNRSTFRSHNGSHNRPRASDEFY